MLAGGIVSSLLPVMGTAAPVESLRVLLVEDDDGDAFLVQELLDEAVSQVELLRARTLAEAEAAVGRRRLRAARPRPAGRVRAGRPAPAGRRRPTASRCWSSPASPTSTAAPRRSPPARRTTWSRARSTGSC